MQLVPGEFNNDGKQDFLAVDTTNHKLRFYPGPGTFGTYILQPDDWTPYGLAVAGNLTPMPPWTSPPPTPSATCEPGSMTAMACY
ncbi:VCBS repeat-containing protein [Streptomyces sp. SID13666]|uniref:FG-GAP repeat domain-containing protein n=1 Tax=unclassified Streptomyces TaxID=2593676 RepID=UPI0013C284B0|nr:MULTISPECIES: VCBS repeat-containing protein [unclassified Streptomyces]NEA59785.1 VCBS repeat-containing protein [Streptomyces sp. SID13666]NEA76776.1 VCBS repeat-containing protein [Streptomyces sp. SID13588]